MTATLNEPDPYSRIDRDSPRGQVHVEWQAVLLATNCAAYWKGRADQAAGIEPPPYYKDKPEVIL